MSADDYLSTSLQENLLVLLAFDDNAAPIIRNKVEITRWGNAVYREFAVRVYDYIDRFKKAPGESHTPDLFEDVLSKKDATAGQFHDLLVGLNEQRPKINAKYALDSLDAFVHKQNLTLTVIEAGEALQQDELDRVELILAQGARQRQANFSPGLRLMDAVSAAFHKEIRSGVVQLGISQLDNWDLGCGDAEFVIYIAPPKTGKTWWLVHNSKRALMQKQRVLYITLELSDLQILQRHMQCFFAVSRYRSQVPVTRISTDERGRLVTFEPDMIGGKLSFDNPEHEVIVERKLVGAYGMNSNLIVKEFPAGQLTMPMLEAYLDMLESTENFVPHKILIDYPKYMKIDPKNYRLEAGVLYDNLRGLAKRRNAGIMVASESNRVGAMARTVRGEHAGEDYSRIYTADTVFTYSQTDAEAALGLGRLRVDSTRVAGKDKFTVLLSQCYDIGQYCVDSAMLTDNYGGLLEQVAARVQDDNAAEDDTYR